jgi:membrane associated rhomboid family serine protease
MSTTLSSKKVEVWTKSLWLIVFGLSTVFFLLSLKYPGRAVNAYALYKTPGVNYFTQGGEFNRYLSYSVLHAGFLHYFMNMFNFYFIYRLLLRYRTNNSLIVIAYILSVVLGGFSQIHFSSRPEIYVVGASGGIFGLYGMMVAQFILRKDWTSVAFAIICDGFLNVYISTINPTIGWIAHLVGAIIGLTLGLIFIPMDRKEV